MEIKEYLLKDICKFETGIDPLLSEKNGNFPFIKLGNTTGNKINYDFSEKINTNRKKMAKNGDLLLCWSCSVGKSFIVEKDCFFSTAFYKLINLKNIYLNKYLYYFFQKNENIISKLAIGSVLKKANMNILGNYKVNLPNIKTQQKIINIIEPFELLKQNFYNKKNKLINLINYLYKYNSQNSDKENYLLSMTNLFNKKYENQNMYIETSNINENMSITNKIKEISKNKKPSRANLSPKNNSLIFAKLRGSQKIFPIYDKKYTNYVYSTGFYNISANDLDWYLLGFLNSKDFIIQKNNNSSGTLMQGITIKDLNKIKIKIPKNKYKLN